MLLGCTMLANAQQFLAPSGGVLNVPSDVLNQSFFKVNVNQQINSVVLNSPSTSGVIISIIFVQDGTGHSVTFGGNVNGSPSVSTAANSSTLIALQFDTSAAAWNLFGGGGSGSGLSGMTAAQVPIAATATTVTSSKAIQGSDTNLLSSGTISGTTVPLCTDAQGGATTTGCPTGATLQTNGTNNASQTTLNFITSTTNAIGGTVTPANSTSTQKFELTGTINPTGGGTGLSNPTAHSLIQAEGSSNFGLLTATGYTGVAQDLSCITGSDCTIAPEGVTVNTQSGATYTALLTDRLGLINLTNNTTSTAVTVPQSGATNFDQSFGFASCNSGTVIATFTPTTSTVNGNATLKLPAFVSGDNPACALWYGDNTNYHAGVLPETDPNGNPVAATSLVDSNGASVVTTTPAANPVNFITCGNSATGALPFCQGVGTDATVGLTLGTKATNNIFSINADGSITVTAASTKAITFNVAGGSNSNVLFKTTTATATPASAQVGASASANAFNYLASNGSVMSDIGPNGIPGLAQTCVISAADYTNSTTTPSTVCSFTLPPTGAAKTYLYNCDFLWESTAATLTGPVIGLNISAAPTQLTGEETEWFAVAGTFATGYLSNTTTGSQTLLTGTAAGVTTTNYPLKIQGTIEGAPTAGSTFIINAAALSNTTSTLNIRRGGQCRITALP